MKKILILSLLLFLTTPIKVYSQNTDKGATEVKTTRLFSNGRVGVAYLF